MATPKAFEFPDYCRCCLTDADELLFEVFVVLEEFNCSIGDLIAGCFGIIISERDESSKSICGACLQDLCITYRFRDRCLRSNQILQEKSTHGSAEVSVMKSDPEPKNTPPAVSCDVKEKSRSVSSQERETQTDELVTEKEGTKLEQKFTCISCLDKSSCGSKEKNQDKSTQVSEESSVMKSDPAVVRCDAIRKNPSISTKVKWTQTREADRQIGRKGNGTQVERRFRCTTGRATFRSRQKLENHVPVQRFVYQCNFCLYRFKRSDDLMLHREFCLQTGANEIQQWDQSWNTPFIHHGTGPNEFVQWDQSWYTPFI